MTTAKSGIGLIDSVDSATKAFEQLGTDTKLGLLWMVYTEMGESITPAAPGATSEQVTQKLLDQVKGLEQNAQLEFMRDLVNNSSTDLTKEYGSYTNDNKLVFWYHLAELMDSGDVIPVPRNYELPEDGQQLFQAITQLDFNEQITVLRHAVVGMGA